jgi:hypothetical protein
VCDAHPAGRPEEQADAASTSSLTPEQREELERIEAIVRDKQVPLHLHRRGSRDLGEPKNHRQPARADQPGGAICTWHVGTRVGVPQPKMMRMHQREAAAWRESQCV